MKLDVCEAALADLDRGGTFLQSGFWASFKAEFGWRPRPFLFRGETAGADESRLLVLERGLGAGLGFAYVPHGPDLPCEPAGRTELLAGLAMAVRQKLSPGSLFLRFDPPWYLAEESRPAGDAAEKQGQDDDESAAVAPPGEPGRPTYGRPLLRSAADVQPPDTVLLDLRPDEEGLLSGMKPKWRYNIRLAEKKGVTVAGIDARGDWRPALETFYKLYEETAARDRIALHPAVYYRRLFELASAHAEGTGLRPDLRVWTATHEGTTLASIITIYRGEEAVYLYGASSNEKRNLMPAYALQWAAIRAAREAGCVEYDFYGIPPRDDPGHPMSGLYRFKTGFGGRIVHRGGSWDCPLRPVLYRAFRAAESARNWYYKDFRKRAR
jgi:lipid II:glycine glycyltransferase (peptidoglycan interpeptide bridge formation enzyme)